MLLKLLTFYYSLFENAYRLVAIIILLIILWSKNFLPMTAKNLNLEVRAILRVTTDFFLDIFGLSSSLLELAGFLRSSTIEIESFYFIIFVNVSLI